MKRKSVPQETQERGKLRRLPEEMALEGWVLEKGSWDREGGTGPGVRGSGARAGKGV